MNLNANAGFGVYDININAHRQFDFSPFRCPLLAGCDRAFGNDAQQQTGYVYGNLNFPRPLTWTLGFSYDHFEQGGLDLKKANPKAGVQWDITEALRLRAAVFRTVKRALVVNQTIEPTQIAGFNQFFDDFNGTEAWQYGVGLDQRLGDAFYLGVEASLRDLNVPSSDPGSTKINNEDWEENLVRAYFYWAPHKEWAFTAEYQYDRFTSQKSSDPDLPQHVNTHSIPLSVRYFNPWGSLLSLAQLLSIRM